MLKIKKIFGRMLRLSYFPLIAAYLIIVLFFAIQSANFFTVNNFLNIALYASIVAILSCTMTLVIVSGHIDLSVGSIMALGSVIIGTIQKAGYPIWIGVVSCFFVCAVMGFVNGVLITQVGINAFITTLAGMQIYRGLAYLITNGKSIILSGDFIKAVGRGYTFGIPNAVYIMIAMVIMFDFIAKYTVFGRRIFVIGGNSQVGFLSGINVNRTLILMFVLNGLLCGLASIIYSSQLGSAMPQNATGMEFSVISAVILGGASLSGGKGSIVGALIGGLLLGTLNNGMVMMNIQTYWQQVIGGVVLVLAVVLDIIKNGKATVTKAS